MEDALRTNPLLQRKNVFLGGLLRQPHSRGAHPELPTWAQPEQQQIQLQHWGLSVALKHQTCKGLQELSLDTPETKAVQDWTTSCRATRQGGELKLGAAREAGQR